MPKSKTKPPINPIIKKTTDPSPVPICNHGEFEYIAKHVNRCVNESLGTVEGNILVTLRKILAVVDHLIVKQQRGE